MVIDCYLVTKITLVCCRSFLFSSSLGSSEGAITICLKILAHWNFPLAKAASEENFGN